MQGKEEGKPQRADLEGNGREGVEAERTDGELGQQAFRLGLCDSSKVEKINCKVLSKPYSILFNTLFKTVHAFIISMQINKSSFYLVTIQ